MCITERPWIIRFHYTSSIITECVYGPTNFTACAVSSQNLIMDCLVSQHQQNIFYVYLQFQEGSIVYALLLILSHVPLVMRQWLVELLVWHFVYLAFPWSSYNYSLYNFTTHKLEISIFWTLDSLSWAGMNWTVANWTLAHTKVELSAASFL
jgi:hypothetical protein